MKAETFVKKYDRRVLEDAGTCNSQEFITFAKPYNTLSITSLRKISFRRR